MPRYIAFLRAINVGGHTVKMDHLRQLFETMGYSRVETFIASGNVIFETRSRNTKAQERKIETRLREALGYEVATFIRTDLELAEIASHKPFEQSDVDLARTFGIAFVADRIPDEARKKLLELRTDLDDFRFSEREIFWLSRTKQGESTISNAVFEKLIGKPATLRGANTIRRLAENFCRR